MYSLGAILYEMITGHPPFHAETPFETLRRVVEEEPRPPTSLHGEVDRDLATILLKCLEKDPQRRYASAAELAEELQRYLRDEPIEARPLGQAERLWRWCRREPTIAVLAAVLLLLLISTAGFGVGLYHREKAKRIEAETRMQLMFRDLLDGLEKDWLQPETAFSEVPATRRRLALGPPLPLASLSTTPTRIVFAVHTHSPETELDTGPVSQFDRFAKFMHFLETNQIGPPLQVDFRIYKGFSNAVEALVRGDADFMRPSPVAYVLARQRQAPLTLLAQQEYRGEPYLHGAIFTLTNTGIDRLEQLKGRAFAFAGPDSCVGNWLPKAELVAVGLTGTDLPGSASLNATYVPRAVQAGHFAAGATDLDHVRLTIKAGAPFRILKELTSVNYPWVATPSLPPEIARAIQQKLLALKDPEILARIDPFLTGFRAARPDDYDALEKQMAQAAQFDNSTPVSAP